MPVRTRSIGANNAATTTTHTISMPAGVQVGDRVLVCFSNDVARATVSTSSTGWSQLGQQQQGTTTNHKSTIFTKVATGSDTLVVTASDSGTPVNSTWIIIALQGDGGTPLVQGDNGASATSAGVLAVPGLSSGETYDNILFLSVDTSTYTSSTHPTVTTPSATPAWTNATHSRASTGNQDSAATWSADRQVSGVTSVPALTLSFTPAEQWISWQIAVLGVVATPVGPVTDSAPTSDTATVDRTRYVPLTEPTPAADPATVFRDYTALPDAATGADAAYIDVLTPVGPVTDSGTGADSLAVAFFIGNDVTDSAPSVDAITVERTTYILLTDSGVGDDGRALEQTRSLTDSGTGADSLAGTRYPSLVEAAATFEFVRVIDIPFTPILPLRHGPLYEMVVVGRLPQIAGPPTFIEVDGIEWKDLRYTNTLSEAQELEMSCQISSVTEPVLQRLRRPHELATELWLYRNGKIVFAGPLVGWRNSGESLTLSAKGLLAYLRLMLVVSDLTFVQQDQFTFVKTLVDQWQNLEFGHFGIDTSAVGASGVLRDGSYFKKELHNVGQRVEEMGKRIDGFDTEINPATRQLQLWYPTKGVDRSTGEDAIVIDARNITSGDTLCSVAVGDLASEGFATGSSSGADASLWSEQANEELRAKYGRSAVTGTWSDVSQQTTLDAYARGLVDARSEALIVPGPAVRVTPDADLDDYGVGDAISYDLAGLLGVSGAFRIRRQSVRVTGTGKESVDLEFV